MVLLRFAMSHRRAGQQPGLMSRQREASIWRQVGNSTHVGCGALPPHWLARGHGGKWVLVLPLVAGKAEMLEDFASSWPVNEDLVLLRAELSFSKSAKSFSM